MKAFKFEKWRNQEHFSRSVENRGVADSVKCVARDVEEREMKKRYGAPLSQSGGLGGERCEVTHTMTRITSIWSILWSGYYNASGGSLNER